MKRIEKKALGQVSDRYYANTYNIILNNDASWPTYKRFHYQFGYFGKCHVFHMDFQLISKVIRLYF